MTHTPFHKGSGGPKRPASKTPTFEFKPVDEPFKPPRSEPPPPIRTTAEIESMFPVSKLTAETSPLGPGMLDFVNFRLGDPNANVESAREYYERWYGPTGDERSAVASQTAAAPAAPSVKELHEFEWKDVEFNVESGQAPSWWVGGRVPKSEDDAADPRLNFMMTMNAMIPYMSPEDQRNAAAQLYAMDANHWSEYKPEKLKTTLPEVGPAGRITTPTRQFFQGRQRSTGAINMLNQLREATVGGNRWKLSPGYSWLQQVLGAGESFGGGVSRKVGGEAGSGQTRAQFLAQLGALDPLLAQSKSGELGGFGAIGRMLSQPFFSRGALRPTTRTQGGRTLFGAQNPLLFG